MTVTIPPPPSESHRQSPFTPGFGASPPALVGRQQEVNDFAYAIDNGPGAQGRATLVTGQRGVGKTATLGLYEQVAQSRGWVAVNASAGPGFTKQLTETRIPEAIDKLDMAETEKSRLKSLSFGLMGVSAGFGRDVENTNPITPDFRHQLEKITEALAENGTGLLITLDEVHRLPAEEMREFADAVSNAMSKGAPVAFAAAGLPEAVSGLVNSNISTFLRRSERVQLGTLTPEDARTALEEPIKAAGGSIEAKALAVAVEESGGHPYALQLIGDRAWRYAGGEEIREAHVRSAVDDAERTMFTQVHEPMMETLTDNEQTFLRAVAAHREPGQLGASFTEVRRQVGGFGGEADRLVDRLEARGIVERGFNDRLHLSLPFTENFLKSQPDHRVSRSVDDRIRDAQPQRERIEINPERVERLLQESEEQVSSDESAKVRRQGNISAEQVETLNKKREAIQEIIKGDDPLPGGGKRPDARRVARSASVAGRDSYAASTDMQSRVFGQPKRSGGTSARTERPAHMAREASSRTAQPQRGRGRGD